MLCHRNNITHPPATRQAFPLQPPADKPPTILLNPRLSCPRPKYGHYEKRSDEAIPWTKRIGIEITPSNLHCGRHDTTPHQRTRPQPTIPPASLTLTAAGLLRHTKAR